VDWWIVKQLRAMVVEDLSEFVPQGYFESEPDKFKLHNRIKGSQHFSREITWGYLAYKLGRRFFFEANANMSARQVSASDVLMNLGLLACGEAESGATAQLSKDAEAKGISDGNAGAVAEQLEKQHVPTFLNNVRGALEQYLRYLTPLEREPFLPLLAESLPNFGSVDETSLLIRLIDNFRIGARILADRSHSRPAFVIENEYDVQDLLFVGIRGVFNDARLEEWTPKHAGNSKRVDIVVPSLGALVETKYIRSRSHARSVADEIKIDIESYHSYHACRSVLVLVYDPNASIPDPEVLETDLSGRRVKGNSTFDVRIMVRR